MSRIRGQLIAFDALDDIRQHCIGAARETNLLHLTHHESVGELDLRTPALLHVLAEGEEPGSNVLQEKTDPRKLYCARLQLLGGIAVSDTLDAVIAVLAHKQRSRVQNTSEAVDNLAASALVCLAP